MRIIEVTEPGVVELSWMWLPTFLGINNQLRKQLEEEINPLVKGMELTEETLDKIHEIVIDKIVEKFSDIEGLREYVEGIKYVCQKSL